MASSLLKRYLKFLEIANFFTRAEEAGEQGSRGDEE